MTAIFGEEVTLVATVKGSEPITVSWVQDKDHILREGENRIISYLNGEATLTVPTTDHTTSGKYTCQLRNDSGQAECVSLVTVLGLYTIGLHYTLGQAYYLIGSNYFYLFFHNF
jgi:titin